MRGHEPLIALRKRRLKPQCVWVEVGFQHSRSPLDWPAETPGMATLSVDDADALSSLDLRCVTGLTTFVLGTEASRSARVRDICIAAGARRVVTIVPGADTTDTDGHLGAKPCN